MEIQWYPGHMTKTKRLIEENIKLVDVIIELLDARAPKSTKNPDIDKFAKNKPKILMLNKSDLANPQITKEWINFYENENTKVVPVISTSGKGIKNVVDIAQDLLKEKIERDLKRGRIYRPIRAMVVGIPNVGKSTFINTLVGKGATKTGDKPGVTKGKQWIKLKKGVELLDMPGILWPKFDDQEVAKKLAYLGSINDSILNIQELAIDFIGLARERFSNTFFTRYAIRDYETLNDHEILLEIGKLRGVLSQKGKIDEVRTSKIIIDDFRHHRMGDVSLEKPVLESKVYVK
ncbi:ribosome biogenesis GTPase YlqF [Candidatus Epulonipiscioides gigas]|nr:ribosome biogenesis GTPase YlqF [Epulopiscium sp. SCG-C07WGA-EpuloA2]